MKTAEELKQVIGGGISAKMATYVCPKCGTTRGYSALGIHNCPDCGAQIKKLHK